MVFTSPLRMLNITFQLKIKTMKTIYFETIAQRKEHLFFAILKEIAQLQNGCHTKQKNKVYKSLKH